MANVEQYLFVWIKFCSDGLGPLVANFLECDRRNWAHATEQYPSFHPSPPSPQQWGKAMARSKYQYPLALKFWAISLSPSRDKTSARSPLHCLLGNTLILLAALPGPLCSKLFPPPWLSLGGKISLQELSEGEKTKRKGEIRSRKSSESLQLANTSTFLIKIPSLDITCFACGRVNYSITSGRQ